jgi:hypothetical protein
MPIPRFLKSVAGWSLVVSAIAVVLSQLSPIADLIKGEQIQLTTANSLNLAHNLGNLGVLMPVNIENTGGKKVKIAKIELVIRDTSNQKRTLVAQTYFSKSTPQMLETPLTSIVLKPGETWNEVIRCWSPYDEQSEAEAAAVMSDVQRSIAAQAATLSPKIYEASDSSVKRAKAFYAKNFSLHQGTYDCCLVVLDAKNRVMAADGYRFTLYEHHLALLASLTEDYKYGLGVYLPSQKPPAAVQVRDRLRTEEALKIYKQ